MRLEIIFWFYVYDKNIVIFSRISIFMSVVFELILILKLSGQFDYLPLGIYHTFKVELKFWSNFEIFDVKRNFIIEINPLIEI